MALHRKLKRAFRVNVHADKRFRPDIAPENKHRLLLARYLDRGAFPVIFTSSTEYAPVGIANHIGREMGSDRALFLLMFSWTVEHPTVAHRLATSVHVYLKRRPNHRVILLCNSETEKRNFDAEGVEAIYCNQNALTVDENLYRPLAAGERIYDAVYNGAMVPWKRRQLAKLVDRCAHIYYQKDDYDHRQTSTLLDEMRRLMPRHAFVNPEVDGIIRQIGPTEVNAVLNQSRVGLCLSAAEGAMLASMEYLLAGLPVVSTPSLGGRDAFADPEYWLNVGEGAEEVRNGVVEMAARNLEPASVRSATLEKIYEHRQRLRRAVAAATSGQALLPDDPGHAIYRQPIFWKTGIEIAREMLRER